MPTLDAQRYSDKGLLDQLRLAQGNTEFMLMRTMRYSDKFYNLALQDKACFVSAPTLGYVVAHYGYADRNAALHQLHEKEAVVIDTVKSANLFTMALRFDSMYAHKAQHIVDKMFDRYCELNKTRYELYTRYIDTETKHYAEQYYALSIKLERMGKIMGNIRINYSL